ncbi:MAG: hypothetical protein U0S48_18625 [Solirubrobacteraceae bacterium]
MPADTTYIDEVIAAGRTAGLIGPDTIKPDDDIKHRRKVAELTISQARSAHATGATLPQVAAFLAAVDDAHRRAHPDVRVPRPSGPLPIDVARSALLVALEQNPSSLDNLPPAADAAVEALLPKFRADYLAAIAEARATLSAAALERLTTGPERQAVAELLRRRPDLAPPPDDDEQDRGPVTRRLVSAPAHGAAA